MALVRLMYASRAVAPFSIEQLNELTATSDERNTFRDLSGILVYSQGCFLQILEGADWMVREIFEKISTDPRHRDVHEINCQPVRDRAYGAWGMACLHHASADTIQLRKIRRIIEQVNGGVDPTELNDAARGLLSELTQSIRRQTNRDGALSAA